MIRGAAVVLAVVALLCEPSVTRSCGPEIDEAVFVSYAQPDPPLEPFVGGSLGILQPSWRQRFLVVAYRRMKGLPYDPWQTMRALEGVSPDSAVHPTWAQRWLAERATVGEIPPPRNVWTENTMQVDDDYVFYEGCLNDAFRTAIETLRDRMRRAAGDRPSLVSWVQAQDRVFANCRGEAALPDPAPAGSPKWLRKDRAYQTAASLFYANRFDEAKAAFEAIARDGDSPWSVIAPYMVARTLTRKGTLTAGYREVDAGALREAERVVRDVLADPRRKGFHEAARRLEGFLHFRLRRAQRLGELSRLLGTKPPTPNFVSELRDLTLLFDHFTAAQVESLAATRPDFEMADWVKSFQAGNASHALDRWRKTRDTPWLLAAISHVRARDAGAEELVKAAEELPPRDPAHPTATYHRARLLAQMGREDAARALLDQLLQGDARSWPRSAQNLLHARRLRLARSPAELLAHAQRVPAGRSNYARGVWPLDDDERELLLLDQDAVWILNHDAAIDDITGLVTRSELSAALRPRLALAAWTRAVLLDREDVAVKMAPLAAAGFPELRAGLQQYAREANSARRRFQAVWVMLHAPGTSPWLRPGFGRNAPPHEREILRDNWWCRAADDRASVAPASEHAQSTIEAELYAKGWSHVPAAAIMNRGTRAAAERARLDSIGTAPGWLAGETLRWADRSPSDPRLPEALALAVRATRYGCSNEGTSAWSRRAFQRLHKRFPNSEWTRRTPYWY